MLSFLKHTVDSYRVLQLTSKNAKKTTKFPREIKNKE